MHVLKQHSCKEQVSQKIAYINLGVVRKSCQPLYQNKRESMSASFVCIVFELNNFNWQNRYDNDDDHRVLHGVLNRP